MRPSETFAIAAPSSEMDQELERLAAHAVVAWLGRVRPDVDVDKVKKAFCYQFGVRAGDISVVKCFPEDFLVTFTHRHHRDAAVACRDFPYGSIDIRIRE